MNEITLKENTEIVDISKEKKPRRRFGDRKDGRRIRSIEPISLVSPFIMETRNGSMNYIKDAVRALECGGDYMEYTCSNNFPTITDSSYSISSLSCSNGLLFMEYGNVVTSVLNKFSYQINSLNQYESDEFVFDNNIVFKRRFYYKYSGNIDRVECLLYVDDTIYNEWIEWYEYFNE